MQSVWSHQAVTQVLQAGGLLNALRQHSLYLSQLQDTIRYSIHILAAIDLPVAVSRYESGLLKLYVPNQSQATRLRFLETELVRFLRQQVVFQHLEKIVVRVEQALPAESQSPSVNFPTWKKKVPHSHPVDKKSADQSLQSQDDAYLQLAMQKLARHMR